MNRSEEVFFLLFQMHYFIHELVTSEVGLIGFYAVSAIPC